MCDVFLDLFSNLFFFLYKIVVIFFANMQNNEQNENNNEEAESKPATFLKKETPTQLFFCEFCEISKNTYFVEHLQTATFK